MNETLSLNIFSHKNCMHIFNMVIIRVGSIYNGLIPEVPSSTPDAVVHLYSSAYPNTAVVAVARVHTSSYDEECEGCAGCARGEHTAVVGAALPLRPPLHYWAWRNMPARTLMTRLHLMRIVTVLGKRFFYLLKL